MNPYKVPRPDGFTAHFYLMLEHFKNRFHTNDPICPKIFQDGGWHKLFLFSLIPKETKPTSLATFCPISLCNVLYNITSKIIANRLKPMLHKLISKNQGGFVDKRKMLGNIIFV